MSKLHGEILTLPKMIGNVGAKTINIGRDGDDGATFIPSVSADGIITWTNDKELPNPEPVNIKGVKGDKGDKGETGQQGQRGEKGDTGATGADGKPGENGADGYSPTANVTQNDNGATITITDKNGTTTATITNGKDGADGNPGADGKDGITPTIGENGNWCLGETDTGKPSRGEKGDTGAAGADGADGRNGADGKSAYSYAVEGGYTGTEEEFAAKMAAPLPGVDDTLTQPGQPADAAKVGEELHSLSEENVKSAELDEDNVVSFKNSAGLVLFTLDLSGLGTPATYGNLVLSVESLTIEEGGTGGFTVALDSAPSANQPVYLAVSDNTRLSASPSSLTFTPENYSTPQTVTVTSAQDDDKVDDTITVTLTSRNVDAKQLLVNIMDDDKYLPFGGKEVVSFIRMSSFATVDSVTTYYDEANDETITQTGQPFIWPFKTGVTGSNLQGTPTKARGLLEANTTGAYSLIEVWNGIAIPSKANNASGMRGINEKAITNAFLNNSWESIAIKLEGMKYRNTAGELATQTLAETVSDVLANELPFTTEGWTKGVTTTVFTATGEVVFYCGNVEVYRIAAPADFVSWDWDLPARSWSDLRYFTSAPRDSIIIVNDAVTSEDITKFYEHEVEANF